VISEPTLKLPSFGSSDAAITCIYTLICNSWTTLRPSLRAMASSLARSLDLSINSSLGIVPHEKLSDSKASIVNEAAKAIMGTKPAAIVCHVNILYVLIVTNVRGYETKNKRMIHSCGKPSNMFMSNGSHCKTWLADGLKWLQVVTVNDSTKKVVLPALRRRLRMSLTNADLERWELWTFLANLSHSSKIWIVNYWIYPVD
jgi:hypothetical protein